MAARNRAPVWTILLNFALTFAVAMLGVRLWFLSQSKIPHDQLQALELVYHQIQRAHVDPPEGRELMWAAIEGMVADLDKHSEFIRPTEVAQFERETTGTYEGIGIVMAERTMPITVKFPLVGGPSERAGLRVGDRLLAVDGERLEASDWRQLSEVARLKLLGDPGTEVRLKIQRGDGDPFEQVITRGRVQQPSVKWARLLDREGGLGYVYLSSFQTNSTAEFRAAVEYLEEASPDGLRGLILDLRFNRGGLLDEAIELTNCFLRRGAIVSVRRRDSEVLRRHEADFAKGYLADLPLVVIVNGRSASASEVTAGALQDHSRAVLVGTRTYGKGVVQSIYQWKELEFRLKLTTAHYYTPNGRSIEGELRRQEDGDSEGGIAPDREVRVDRELTKRIRAGLGYREPPRKYRPQVEELVCRLELTLHQPLAPDDDPQLAAALEELRNRAGAGGSQK